MSGQRLATILGLAVCGTALAGHILAFNFVTDDAYISFRFAENLALHGQLVFNLGERVEGYTNFLWTMLLAGGILLGIAPEWLSRVLAAGCSLTTLVLVFRLGRRLRPGPLSPLHFVGPLLLAGTPAFAAWSSGGLETALFSLLALAALSLYLEERGHRPAFPVSGLLFFLCALTRPEGLLLFGLAGLHRVASCVLVERRVLPRRAAFLWVLGFLLPYGLYYLWRYRYYGYPFPNTFYIKSSAGTAALRVGGRYLWSFFLDSKLYVLLPLLAFLRPRRQGGLGLVVSLFALVLAVYGLYVASVGGDFMALHRFLAPLVPLLAVLVQQAICDLAVLVRLASRPRLASALLVVLLGLWGWNAYAVDRATLRFEGAHDGIDSIAYLRRFADDRILVGRWLRTHAPADALVAVGGAGALPYASRLPILDALGLNDLHVAHKVAASSHRPGHQKAAPDDYILSRRPALICWGGHWGNAPWQPGPDEERLWRRRGYHPICMHPEGMARYYCCWKRLDVGIGPFPPQVGG